MSERDLLKAVAEYVIAEGSEKEAARDRVAELLAGLESGAGRRQLDGVAREVLAELGCPYELKGHDRLVCALVLIAQDPTLTQGVTKQLYPEVAKRFGEQWHHTERNIRSAVEAVFERNGAELIDRYFGNAVDWEKGKLTNKAFLVRVAEIIRQRAGWEDADGM